MLVNSAAQTSKLAIHRQKSSAVAEMANRGHNRHRPKREGAADPLLWVHPRLTQLWPGPRSTSVPSGILIHRAVWPQQT